MDQMTMDVHKPETLPAGYLPCSNPDLVEGYMAISEILEGYSTDHMECGDEECEERFCEHVIDSKRQDYSYRKLLEHFKNGGMINIPILREGGSQSNGHHRVVAAMDAGYTHVPYQTPSGNWNRAWKDDWSESFVQTAEETGFTIR